MNEYPYPKSEAELRICALQLVLGCNDPESGISIEEAIKQAEMVKAYISEGAIPTKAKLVTVPK